MKRKIARVIAAVAAAAVICTALGSLVTYIELGTANVFGAATGLVKVTLTDCEYAVIQREPQVIIAQPDASLDRYMAQQGYERDTEQQMGALCVFTDGQSEQYIMYSENRYFSKWRWQ